MKDGDGDDSSEGGERLKTEDGESDQKEQTSGRRGGERERERERDAEKKGRKRRMREGGEKTNMQRDADRQKEIGFY